jgi:mannosyltransferase OCH1-like enzyme
VIPKIIWQTHENKYEDLLPFQKNVTNTWKNLNPGWEYSYVSAEERSKEVQEYDDFLYECYKQCSGINQAEIWRIVVLYKYGGFYADMDSVCTMPLDSVISQNYNNKEIICSPPGFQIGSGYINDSNFAAVKNSKMIKLIINKAIVECENIIRNKKFDSFLHPGSLVLVNFFDVVIKNKNNILFKNNYFSHSRDYQSTFNESYSINYNDQIMSYSDLAKEKGWTI